MREGQRAPGCHRGTLGYRLAHPVPTTSSIRHGPCSGTKTERILTAVRILSLLLTPTSRQSPCTVEHAPVAPGKKVSPGDRMGWLPGKEKFPKHMQPECVSWNSRASSSCAGNTGRATGITFILAMEVEHRRARMLPRDRRRSPRQETKSGKGRELVIEYTRSNDEMDDNEVPMIVLD